jgi:transcriptional regulator with XRE-family HTH domain
MSVDSAATGGQTHAVGLGPRIRSHRQTVGLSLRELARRLDVSPSLLSQVERGLAQPSVSTLWAIVTELGLSLDALFAMSAGEESAGEEHPAQAQARVQRADDRRVLDLAGGVRWERLTPTTDADADFAYVTYPPGGGSADGSPAVHRGKEYGYIVSGHLAVQVDSQEFVLGPGDSIVFSSEAPHRFRAVGAVPACAVWMNLTR